MRKIPDPSAHGRSSRQQIATTLRETASALNEGEVLLLYPAGRVYRQKHEHLGSNGAVAFLVRACPELRIVLVRTTGLWGSSFGRAGGQAPAIGIALRRGIIGLLKSGVFFAPRRRVTVEFTECTNFPRDADRDNMNRFLEAYYNAEVPPATYVPYSFWERGGTRTLLEPNDAN